MTTIIYHKADPDGWFSNSVCRKFISEPVQSIGWDYGDPLPILPPEGDIYMVDISVAEILDDPILRRRVIWIDHHKTAIEKWGPKDEPYRGALIEGVAACRLCWWYLWYLNRTRDTDGAPDWSQRQPGEPEVLFLVGLRDVWKHTGTEFEDACNHLNLALVARRDDENQRAALLRDDDVAKIGLSMLKMEGAAIQRYADSLNREHAERGAMLRRWKGLNWMILNSQARGSKTLEDHAWPLGDSVDALMVWAVNGEGEVNVSFYHAPARKDLDLSVFAKELGGGGHPGACGARVNLAWIEKLINADS